MSGIRPGFREARVAFVILAWNSERVIGPCLESVLSLECGRLDVWVVDNGSSDSTSQILSGLASRDSRLHVISEAENLGTTVSRNKALRSIEPDTDYVCVLDSDTIVNQSAFDEMAAALVSDSSIGVIGPTMANSAGEEQLSGRNLPTVSLKLRKACPFGSVAERAAAEEIPSTPIVDGLQDVGYLLSACWLIPRESLDSVGLLDEKIFYAPEDVEWCHRCHDAGLRVSLCRRARIIHEYQRVSHKRLVSKMNLEHIRGLVYYFRKVRFATLPPFDASAAFERNWNADDNG